MLLLFTSDRRLKLRWPFPLAIVVLTLSAALAPCPLKAQAAVTQEIATKDVEPTFKLKSERNMVMVRVVVRDAKGMTVDNLRKEDFTLTDKGKAQTILQFSVERPAVKATATPEPKAPPKTTADPEDADETAIPISTARRYVAIYFDDVNTSFEYLARSRDAADKYVAKAVQPGDRVGLFTSSGLKQLDFTDNLAQIHQALFDLRPRPIAEPDRSCDSIPPYQAYQIVENQDPIATNEAVQEILNCDFQGNQANIAQATGMVQGMAMRARDQADAQALAAMRGIESIVRRMKSLPGQRSMVIVSAGFLTETLHFELSQITDRALRAGVIINAMDARGLWTDPALTDVSNQTLPPPPTARCGVRSK